MTLTTFSGLPFTSPLAEARHSTTRPAPAGLVTLADISHHGYIHIRGHEAEQALRTMYENVPAVPGTAAAIPDGMLGRLRTDEFALFVWARSVNEAMQHLKATLGDKLITVTDLTHGRAGMVLAGLRAVDVLAKMCGLDFHDLAFPDLHITHTSLAKVRTLILRNDTPSTPAYHLIVERSLGKYVWGVVVDAMQE